MSSGFSRALACLALVVAAMVAMDYRLVSRERAQHASGPGQALQGSGSAHAPDELLRVCADPNNLPFSNRRREGFENVIAALLAQDLGKTLHYTWWPQRRGFVRNTLQAGECDLVMGVPRGYELLETTTPYYRSTYVFVTRRDRSLDIASFDDVRLRKLRIGLHAIGDDYGNVPPAQALDARGLASNIRGYSIYGAYSQPDPPKTLIEAVARGEIDVAVAWGPLAGYFARRQTVKLDLHPVIETALEPSLPMTFAISMGVRRGDHALRVSIEDAIARRADDIHRVLTSYGVPLVEETEVAHFAHASGSP